VHAGKAGGAGTPKQIDQTRLDQIVRMVSEKDSAAPAAASDSRKKFIASIASGSFDGLLRSPRQRSDTDATHFAFRFQLRGHPSDEPRVRCARASPQLMIEMADNEAPVSQIG
jgi:hypothetical protein